jgi:pyruvate-ferredoxin/flavodoxin oxidoreductase
LTPDHPVIRGTTQNPDVYFQGRETVNAYYLACPTIVQNTMDRLAALTGRSYHLFDYVGAPDAERVLVLMGSAAETAQETVSVLVAQGEKVGVVKVRLFRPFSVEHFIESLPKTVRAIGVSDRTKEPGSVGEPLYQEVLIAVQEAVSGNSTSGFAVPRIIGGRYGLSSKEFTPAMVKAIFDELAKPKPRNHFTIGIHDDVTHTSLEYDPAFSTEDPNTIRAIFYGLGADGTVGANKNTIKIIGEETDQHVQGYFVYDSKKSGSVTISHLRFGPRPIHSTYLIERANFVACHQFSFLERFDVLKAAEPGAIFLLNSPYKAEEVWNHLPRPVQEQIIGKKLRFFVIDGYDVSRQTGMGQRINTIMQSCFFAISGILPRAGGHCGDQENHHQNLSEARRGGGAKEFCRRRCRPGSLGRGARSRTGKQYARDETACAVGCAGLRSEDNRPDHRRRRRCTSGERLAPGWHLSDWHHPLGEVQHCPGDPRLESKHLHSVREVRAGLPARRYPGQSV